MEYPTTMYYEEETTHEQKYSAASCFACLSSDRKLFALGDYSSLFSKFFNCDNLPDLRPISLCWECTAVLRKVKLFKEKVDHAQSVLSYHYLSQNTPTCLSSLQTTDIEISSLGGPENQSKNSKPRTNDIECTIEPAHPSENEHMNEVKVKIEPFEDRSGLGDGNNGFENDNDDKRGFEDDDGYNNDTYMLGWDSDNSDNTGQFIGSTVGVIGDTKKKRGRKKKHVEEIKVENKDEKKTSKTTNSMKRKKMRSSAATALKKVKKLATDETVEIEKVKKIEKPESESESDTDNFKNKNAYIKKPKPESDEEDEEYLPSKKVETTAEKPNEEKDSNSKASVKRFQWVTGVKKAIKVDTVPVDLEEVRMWMDKDKKTSVFQVLKTKCDNCVHAVDYTHYRYHFRSPARSLRCPICDICCRTQESRAHHINVCHTSLLRCTECGYKCYVPEVMDYHVWKHSQKVQCKICGDLYDNEEHFKEHRAICDQCGAGFKNKSVLERHMTKHRPRSCEQCPKTFTVSSKYWHHVTYIHPNLSQEQLEALYCVTCDKQMKNKTGFDNHIRNHPAHARERQDAGIPDVPKEKLQCPLCSNVYHSRNSLRKHHLFEHLQEYKYTCSVCQKAYPYKSGLDTHIQTVHEGFKPPKDKYCHFCGRGFSNKRILENHIRTHTGERPYQCDYCNARFAQRVAWKQHVKFIHLKERRGNSAKENAEASCSYNFYPS